MIEVLRRFDLFASISPFRRCLHCNAPLQAVPKELIHHRLLRKTEQHYDEFHICRVGDWHTQVVLQILGVAAKAQLESAVVWRLSPEPV